jgi:hypothetical protein
VAHRKAIDVADTNGILDSLKKGVKNATDRASVAKREARRRWRGAETNPTWSSNQMTKNHLVNLILTDFKRTVSEDKLTMLVTNNLSQEFLLDTGASLFAMVDIGQKDVTGDTLVYIQLFTNESANPGIRLSTSSYQHRLRERNAYNQLLSDLKTYLFQQVGELKAQWKERANAVAEEPVLLNALADAIER